MNREDGRLLDRIRWGNVTRAAALAGAAALLLAWPRLGSRAPALPPAAPVPVVAPAPRAAEPRSRVVAPAAVRHRARRSPARRRRRAPRHGRPAHLHSMPAVAIPSPAPPGGGDEFIPG